MISGPSTGLEVFTPGRQGIRAKRDLNPASGSADLFETPSAVFPLFLAVASRQRRVMGSAAGAAGGQHTAQRRPAPPVCCSAWFGLAVALAQLRFGLYSSPDGPYITGTGTLFRRR
jgi:hypothetical protein